MSIVSRQTSKSTARLEHFSSVHETCFIQSTFFRKVRAVVGDSSLCCCLPCHTCDVNQLLLTPFACRFLLSAPHSIRHSNILTSKGVHTRARTSKQSTTVYIQSHSWCHTNSQLQPSTSRQRYQPQNQPGYSRTHGERPLADDSVMLYVHGNRMMRKTSL